jgi:hypothetical protein
MPSPDFSELKFASVDLSLDKERCWEKTSASVRLDVGKGGRRA